MAKFYGNVGFAETVETSPSVWTERIIDRPYFGDVIRRTRRLESSGDVNGNVNITNQISIIADPYANQNLFAIRYVEFMGTKWKVSDVDIQYPRLVLTIGGVYNV